MLEKLMVDLLNSWGDSDDEKVKDWELGGDWPEMDALVKSLYVARLSRKGRVEDEKEH